MYNVALPSKPRNRPPSGSRELAPEMYLLA